MSSEGKLIMVQVNGVGADNFISKVAQGPSGDAQDPCVCPCTASGRHGPASSKWLAAWHPLESEGDATVLPLRAKSHFGPILQPLCTNQPSIGCTSLSWAGAGASWCLGRGIAEPGGVSSGAVTGEHLLGQGAWKYDNTTNKN